MVFPETDEGMAKAGKFIEDTADPAFEAAFTKMKNENPDLVDAWDVMEGDANFRIDVNGIEKVDGALSGTNPLTKERLKSEFNDLPNEVEKTAWQKHLELRTYGNRVRNPADKASHYGSFTINGNNSNIPDRYFAEDLDRFVNLATDSGSGGGTAPMTSKTMQEAMVGLQAEAEGLVPAGLQRYRNDSGELNNTMEFNDGNGVPWDVKEPTGNYFNEMQATNTANKIIRELRENTGMTNGNPTTPPGQAWNPITGEFENRRVLLSTTFINQDQLTLLRQKIDELELTPEELDRITEVNINLE